jgi:putative alpha-1,2-mannosidase
MGVAEYVDIFHGNFESELPKPEGVAASWFFLKAQTGNTHPGAVLPFGAVSACSYTGGYPTGYSPYWGNSHSRPPRIMDPARLSAAGFSHFHQSGTGSIGFYYNYFILTPVAGEYLPERFTLLPVEDEKGEPGFYSCILGGIPVNITASSRMSCYYQLIFPTGGGSVICDPELNGLFRDKKYEAEPGRVITQDRGNDFIAVEIQYNFVLSVYLRCPDAKSIKTLSDGRLAIQFDAGETELSMGFSFNGMARAKEHAEKVINFNGTRSRAKNIWEQYLGAVEIDADAEQREIFYSCLYHSLVKPCDVSGDSPHWNDRSCWTDLATMWDMYKAQLPLLFTLYNQEGTSLVNSFIGSVCHLGYFPNRFCLIPPDRTLDYQARALTWHSIYDAFIRGIPADYALALDYMEKDLKREPNNDFLQKGITEPYPSHTWDLTCACFAAGLLAKALMKEDKATMFFRYSENWQKVMDKTTGLITSKGSFYEGNEWNYSFRLLPQTASRIADNKDAFVKNLDTFFGFGAPPVTQNIDPKNIAGMKAGESLSRFEGFNNETDMETPYAYIYAGRHDRTAEICRYGMDAMFTRGRGGLCGNDDSGGLSAMYLCNTLGLFPASGLPYLFIGSPILKESRLCLRNGNIFNIRCHNFDKANRYVKRATLNAKPLTRAWLWVEELMAGGTIDLDMSAQPVAWDIEPPPAESILKQIKR